MKVFSTDGVSIISRIANISILVAPLLINERRGQVRFRKLRLRSQTEYKISRCVVNRSDKREAYGDKGGENTINILFLSSYAVIRILGSGSGLTTER